MLSEDEYGEFIGKDNLTWFDKLRNRMQLLFMLLALVFIVVSIGLFISLVLDRI